MRGARARGVRLIGPHCTTLMRPGTGFDAGLAPGRVKPGHVALVSQSGALVSSLIDWAAPAGVGAMAAVLGAEDALVQDVCTEAAGSQVVVPANFNSPGQIVIGGDADAVDRALALLAEKGVRKAVKLAVSVPSHTPLMREAANRLSETLRGLSWQMPISTKL